MRKHKGIKLVKKRRNYLVLKPNYHTTKFFTKNLLVIEIRKTQILINKPVYLVLSVLVLNKTVMCEFWYDYVKPKYGENAKLHHLDTDSFTVYVKSEDIYKDFAEDVETRFDTLNFKLDRQLSKGENKKVIGLMKDGFGREIIKEF